MSIAATSFKFLSQLFASLAVLASVVFVGYELKQNNDLAIVQSHYELLALNVEMKGWLTDPDTLAVLMTEDRSEFSKEEKILFLALVGAWFDLYELAYLSQDRGLFTDEQFVAWRNGLCTLPAHWLQAFESTINEGNNYMQDLRDGVQGCLDASN